MYDYAIVGAGSAGCVLASRLTEDPNVSVLLVEAGGSDRKQEIAIPAAFSKLFKTPYDWAYFTEEQPRLHQRKLYWPRGKVVGGSSSINAMIYIRGNHADYDEWAALGNPGWSFAEVLPYFKRAEHQERGPSEYHGVGGPVNVADLRTINPLSTAFVDAASELGIARTDDFNGATQEGAGYYQVTQKGGKRCSASVAYLRPAARRANLTVRTGAQVTRLLTEGTRVTGIEFVRNGVTERQNVHREVLLCGGTINSPQVLMLSGIGPADHLHALDIDVLVDLPGVGQNLQDHLAAGVAFASKRPVTLDHVENVGNLLRYLIRGRGPFTSNVAEAGGFVRIAPGTTTPDLQFHFGPVYFIDHGFTKPEGYGFTIGPTHIDPISRGQISLRSANPLDAPIVEPNYLGEDGDLRVLVDGFKLARQLAHAGPFDAFRGPETLPGEQARSDADIIEHIRATAETLYHPVGTCKMGNDAMAVVDSELRVRGVDGLRVVDASIMPTVPSGNTNAPTIMIAEKAADLIKQAR